MVRFSVGLPVEQPHRFEELCSGEAMAELARAAEDIGYDAVSVTDHPFPPDRWLASGGHHSYDPLVVLAFVAAATRTIRLQTNVLVTGYRNAFLSAKGVSSLDALSNGRVILGLAAGYLQEEYAALGADFEGRNERLDETIQAMRAAWTGETVSFDGATVRAHGHTMSPPPVQSGGPPIWIGGNSTRAIRRAVEFGDGWLPFPLPSGASRYTRTADINDMEDLRRRIDLARDLSVEHGRTKPLEICFVPFELSVFGTTEPDYRQLGESVAELSDAGVTWLSITLPATTRRGYLEQLESLAEHVMGTGA